MTDPDETNILVSTRFLDSLLNTYCETVDCFLDKSISYFQMSIFSRLSRLNLNLDYRNLHA